MDMGAAMTTDSYKQGFIDGHASGYRKGCEDTRAGILRERRPRMDADLYSRVMDVEGAIEGLDTAQIAELVGWKLGRQRASAAARALALVLRAAGYERRQRTAGGVHGWHWIRKRPGHSAAPQQPLT